MSAATIERASVLTGRQLVLGVVIVLHALGIGALMSMRISVPDKPPPILKAVTSVDPLTPQPMEPRPVLEAEQLVTTLQLPQVPVPVVQFPEVQWSAPDLAPPVQPAADAGSALPGEVAVIAPTELAHRVIRSPDDYYPATSLQLQEEGVAIVRVCVGPDGRLDGRPVIERGSGSRRLDAAALQWAGEALAFTPATRNGSPVAACKGFRVNFRLR